MISLTELLNEIGGVTYKNQVLFLSRDFIQRFKKSMGKKFKYKEFGQVPGVDGMEEEINFEFKVSVIPNTKLKGHPYSIDAGAQYDEIDMTVEYNPLVFPAAFNDFIAEIKDAIRHEMEHIAQQQKGTSKWEDRGDKPFYQYLLLPQEIPAYIKGLNKRAKVKRITLGQAIEEYFKEYKDSFKNQGEIDVVRREWMKWAEKNLPKTKI
jgi:hypothetical protein